MCLPELLMDVAIIKGDTVKLSVISAARCHFDTVSAVTGCDVIFSCHVTGLLIKDVADREHNGPDCVAQAGSEEKEEEEGEETDFDLSLSLV